LRAVNKFWTEHELAYAQQAKRMGYSCRQISYALDRSIKSVQEKLADPDCKKRAARDFRKRP